jgi:hypothetical protein
MADFSGMITGFATPSVTLRRYVAQTLSTTTGRFNDPSSSDTALVASVQRPTGRQLQLLPENQRTQEAIAVYTSTLLRTAKPASNLLADRIVYGGDVYEVQTLIDWVPAGNFCQALAVKVGQ